MQTLVRRTDVRLSSRFYNLYETSALERNVFPRRICSNNALVQVKDLQVKLDEAEQQAMKGGRKVGMWSTM